MSTAEMRSTSPPESARNAVEQRAAEALAAGMRGVLVRQGDVEYERWRRVWNASIDRRPALVARCAGVADVVAAVRFAREHGLLVAVRSGGHSFPGHSVCDGGLVIDLSLMKSIQVNPEARTVRVQAGVLLGELDLATQSAGLAVPAGIVTHTGVAGLTLGGGMGWLMRKYGLTIDQLRSVELVTSGGELVRADAVENADLFWGVRGGGGNFGIVTAFTFGLDPVGPTVLAGPVFWSMAQSPRLLRFYRDWIAEAPDELMTIVVHRKAPALPFIPPQLRGQPVVGVVCCYTGRIEDGERLLKPLRRFGSPVLDLCEPKSFVSHQAMFDASFPHGWWYYFRACNVAELTDEVIDITVEYADRIGSPQTVFPIWHLGGAMARVPEDATAFHGRAAGFAYNITGVAETATGFAREQEWVRAFWSALAPHHSSVYVNFLMDEGGRRIRQAYGPEKYDRLRALKRRYDPDNVFRLNQNIPPAAPLGAGVRG